MIIRGREIAAKTIALTVAGAFLLFAVIMTLAYCQNQRSKGAQARVERSQAEAASNSAADAVGTVARSGEASAASEALTRDNEGKIRAADGANAPVNPAARDAGITALCKRQAYQSDPRCKR